MSFLDKARPVATTTPSGAPSFVQKARPVQKPVVEEPKQDGFFKSLVKDAAKTILVKPAARVAELVGRTGVLGENIQRGYQEMSKAGEGQRIFGIDVEAQKGFGQGGAKQILGDALKSTSYLYGGGKVAQVGGATLKGQMLRGFIQGAKGGAVGGASYGAGTELQREGSTTKSVLAQGAIGGVVGGVTGGALGGLLPVPVAAVKGTQTALNPSKIMQRVARVNALDEQKFQQTAKESIGDYLVKRGIYGDDEQIMAQLAQRFTQSKQVADDAIAKLPGTYKPQPVRTALSEMIERETRVSSPGAPSKDYNRVAELVQKYDTQGLTMTEINEVKRIFERNNKLDYLRQNLPESVARANTLDDAIRNWQFKQADDLGLKNLGEINKETRLAKQLGDALYKKNVRSSGNNAFGLTDAILISGGDPQAIGMLVAKKTFGSKGIQSKVAKTIAGEPTVGMPQAVFGDAISPQQRIPTVEMPKTPQPGTLDLRAIQGASTQSLLQSGTKQSKATLPKTVLPVKESSSRLSGQGKEMFAGGAIGLEKDENGEWTFNEEKALAGMIGVAGLTRSQRVQKLAQALDDKGVKILDDFVTAVKAGGVSKDKKGMLVFKEAGNLSKDEVEEAFMRGLDAVNDEKPLTDFAGATPSRIANLYKDILDARNKTGKYGVEKSLGSVTPKATNNLTDSIAKAKAEGKTFEEWVKGQNTNVTQGLDSFKSEDDLFDAIIKEPLEAGIDRKNLSSAYRIGDTNTYVIAKKTGKSIDERVSIVDNTGKEISSRFDKAPELEYRIAVYDENIDDNLYNAFLRARKGYTKLDDVQSKLAEDFKTRSQLKAEWDAVGGKTDDLVTSIKEAKAEDKTFEEWVNKIKKTGLTDQQKTIISKTVATQNNITDYSTLSVEQKGKLFNEYLKAEWDKVK